MPVMLAGAVGDISIQNVPDYATLNKHGPPADSGGDQAERPVLIGIKADGKVAQCAISEGQRFAMDGDRHIF